MKRKNWIYLIALCAALMCSCSSKTEKIEVFTFFNMLANFKSPPKIKNAIGVAADLILNKVVSSITKRLCLVFSKLNLNSLSQ